MGEGPQFSGNDLFWKQAEKYQVLPLDNSVVARLLVPKPSLSAGRNVFTYRGKVTGTPNGDAPSILNSSYNFTAEVEIPKDGGEGMLVTQGGRFGGYGFYIPKGKPVFTWNLVDLKRIRWEGPDVVTPGKHTLEFDFKYDGLGMETLMFGSPSGIGRGGRGSSRLTARPSPPRPWNTPSPSFCNGKRISTLAPIPALP